MSPRTRVTGVIVGQSGDNKRGARVMLVAGPRVFPLDLSVGSNAHAVTTESGPDGAYAFEFPADHEATLGDHVCLMAVSGSEVSAPVLVQLREGSTVSPPPLRLRPGDRGVVRLVPRCLANGMRASVAVIMRFARDRVDGGSECATSPPALLRCMFFSTTDEQGEAPIGPLPRSGGSSVRIIVNHPVCVNLRANVRGGVAELIGQPVRLRKGLIARGRVMDATGTCYPGVPIAVRSALPNPSTIEDSIARTWTWSDGSFEVRGVPSSFGMIQVGPLSYGLAGLLAPALVEVSRHGHGRVVELGDVIVRVDNVTTVKGAVVTADGAGTTGAIVYVMAPDAHGRPVECAYSGATGVFELLVPATGSLTIVAMWRDDHEREFVGSVDRVAPGESGVVIRLERQPGEANDSEHCL